MAFNALEALREGGHTIDGVAPEKLAVLAALSPQEVDVLNSIRERLNPEEVTAHVEDTTVGALVW
ncbi:aroma-sacti cluster domain-containing protein [Streptomyces sp. V4-01]|jgi:hypothetical protein|uniref:Aroma-sacti cluster domain-containing protein n=1 Tax=Actinacidiphila polyblastidii TaxID=3110430 RepID=A0ABU7PLS7_9ACTN|nr:aroma-sacti cluster domain-containing protein [Streptomyces sp. V4-01]